MKFKQAKIYIHRYISRIYLKKIKQIYQKSWEAIHYILNVGRKSKSTSCSSTHNGAFTLQSSWTFSSQILDPKLQKEFVKEKKSPITYLNDKI